MPFFKLFGIFKITFFRQVTVLSGAGVGGGSLVYANTLPIPKSPYFQSDTWSSLADWEKELAPFYKLSKFMLGATPNPKFWDGDYALHEIAKDLGSSSDAAIISFANPFSIGNFLLMVD